MQNNQFVEPFTHLINRSRGILTAHARENEVAGGITLLRVLSVVTQRLTLIGLHGCSRYVYLVRYSLLYIMGTKMIDRATLGLSYNTATSIPIPYPHRNSVPHTSGAEL